MTRCSTSPWAGPIHQDVAAPARRACRPRAGVGCRREPPHRRHGAALGRLGRSGPAGAPARSARRRARPAQTRHRFDAGASRATRGRSSPLIGAVLLVGDAPYYSPFGFSSEKTNALWLPGPYERHRLLGRELKPGALDGARGLISAAGPLEHTARSRDPRCRPGRQTTIAADAARGMTHPLALRAVTDVNAYHPR